MSRTRTGLLAVAFASTLLAVSAVPAMAGDVKASHGSVVGEWKTRTDGVRQTVTFDDEGRVFGDSGCNRFTGGYTIKRDGRISIGPLASTMMFCEGRMDAERTLLSRLEAAVSYHASTTKLRLSTPDEVITFRPA